jgi:hypothetical protein
MESWEEEEGMLNTGMDGEMKRYVRRSVGVRKRSDLGREEGEKPDWDGGRTY